MRGGGRPWMSANRGMLAAAREICPSLPLALRTRGLGRLRSEIAVVRTPLSAAARLAHAVVSLARARWRESLRLRSAQAHARASLPGILSLGLLSPRIPSSLRVPSASQFQGAHLLPGPRTPPSPAAILFTRSNSNLFHRIPDCVSHRSPARPAKHEERIHSRRAGCSSPSPGVSSRVARLYRYVLACARYECAGPVHVNWARASTSSACFALHYSPRGALRNVGLMMLTTMRPWLPNLVKTAADSWSWASLIFRPEHDERAVLMPTTRSRCRERWREIVREYLFLRPSVDTKRRARRTTARRDCGKGWASATVRGMRAPAGTATLGALRESRKTITRSVSIAAKALHKTARVWAR